MEKPENPLIQWLTSIQPEFSTKDAWASQDKFLSLLVETMNDGLLVENQQGEIVYANRRLCEMTGYSCQELAGQKSTLMIEPNDIPIYLEKTASRKSIKSETYELRCQTKQEKSFFVTASVQALFDAQNQYVGNIAVLTDITGIKENQEYLEKSEKMARLLIDATMVGFFLCDLKGIVHDVNENMASRFNKTRGQLLGTCVWDLFPDEVTARRMAVGLEALKTKKSVHFIEERNGFWTDSVAVPVFDAQGNIERLAIFSQDITQQKKAELQLRQSEQNVRTLINATHDAVGMVDLEGKILDINEVTAARFKRKREDLIGTVIWDYFPPEVAARRKKAFQEVCRTKKPTREIGENQGLWSDNNIYPVLDPKGEVTGVVAFSKDITKQREAEQQLKQSEQSARTLINATHDAVIFLDLQGNILDLNQTMSDRLMKTREEIIGTCIWNTFSDEVVSRRKKAVQDVCRSKKPGRLIMENQGVWSDSNIYPVFDSNGEVSGVVVFGKDITEQRKLELELQKKEELYRQVVENSLEQIVIIDLQGTILFVNSAAAKVANVPAEKIIGAHIRDYLDPETIEKNLKLGAQAVADQEIITSTGKARIREHWQWYEVAYIPLQQQPPQVMMVVRDVTERMAYETRLKDSETRYRTLADFSFEAILFHDHDILLDANDRMFELFGYTREDLIGKNILAKIVTPATAHEVRKQIQKTGYAHVIGEAIKKDGTIFQIEARGKYLEYKGRQIRAVTLRDISQLVENERKIRESEEKYRAMVETAREAIAILDYEGRYHFMNQIGADRLKTSVQEVVGKKMSRFFPRNIADLQLQILRKCLDTGIGTTAETETFVDGRPCCYETTIEPIRNADGIQDKVLVIARDISDKKMMIDQLRVSEEKYRSLVENADDVIVIYDRKGRLLFMNTIGAQLSGYQQTDIVGKTLWELIPKKIADEFFEQIQVVIQTSKPTKKILQMPAKGKMWWKVFTFSPLRNIEGQAYAVQIISKDITEMKIMEEKLTLYRSKMAITERLAQVGVISSSMAHELNQPLTVIRLHMDDILENLKKKGIVEFQTQFHALFKEINKTSAITQRYLKLSRPAASEETKQWNFSATLDLLRDALQTAANSTGFEIWLDNTLRKIPSYSYSGDLEQIFFILMQNAIQAAEEKKGTALRISASRRKEFLVLRFEDNCGGIPKKQLEKIFEPFYSTKSRDQGTGLGLTIVRQILEEHGGKIQVQSQLRKGTVFSLWLPCPLANSSRKKKRQPKEH